MIKKSVAQFIVAVLAAALALLSDKLIPPVEGGGAPILEIPIGERNVETNSLTRQGAQYEYPNGKSYAFPSNDIGYYTRCRVDPRTILGA